MKALGIDLGTLQIKQEKVGENTYYHNKTIFDINLLFKKVKMEIKNQTHYQGGQLMTSRSSVIANGELRSTSAIVWDNNQYDIQVDGEPRPGLEAPVTFSGTLLYFVEPRGISEVFSESSGVFMPVELVKQGVYRVTDPETNRDMIRTYQGGKQVKVKIKHPLLSISLSRIDPASAGS
jgi:hypothetical protein